jgi:hypothetical protein
MADGRARAESVLALPRKLGAAVVIALIWLGVAALLGVWAYRAFAAH